MWLETLFRLGFEEAFSFVYYFSPSFERPIIDQISDNSAHRMSDLQLMRSTSLETRERSWNAIQRYEVIVDSAA